MEKIRVLHIIKSLGRGGAEMLLPETLKIHDKTKFDFHYIYFLPWKDQMVSEIVKAGGKVTCLSASNNIKILLKSNEIVHYCRENRIQLIHCHLPWAGFLGRVIHKRINISVIYSEHNMQERYHVITKVLNKLTFNYQTLALGVSNDVTNSIIKNIKPKILVKTLLNGVNTLSFVRQDNLAIRENFNIPKNAVVIGNVAVFRFQKRLVEWLKVMKYIVDKNSNVYGIIVGAGPLELEVKNELKELNLENRVFIAGLQTNVKPYFEAMDIFMMSSSFEGLPIALLESMSMECAVVSTDAGGIKEVIRHKEDGLICDVKNWKELSFLSQSLIDNPELLKKYKRTARERVVKNFSLITMVEKLEKFYTEFSNS